jgi:[ribosomal protein S5]-alanine N-acetyltransferase
MFALIQCDANGQPIEPVAAMGASLAAACAQSAELYRRVGFEPPWVSYVAVSGGVGVGGGAFVGPPRDGLVEIAYFTLDDFQGRGYATRIAQELVRIARQAALGVSLKAFTLPQVNPSTRILERLGFRMVGFAHDADAGEVWEWRA